MKEITIGQAHENTQKLNQNISTDTAVFLIEKDSSVRQNISIKFPCAYPMAISSTFGKSFHFPFPYFECIYTLLYAFTCAFNMSGDLFAVYRLELPLFILTFLLLKVLS